MSYQVLARKWRPRNFKEMAGQAHVLQTLVHALENGRLHHAYLFTGTRGVGKTTIARILAKCLNCENGVTATPCDQCSACKEISEGRFIDLIEVDAASRTKVEDTRELLENVQYLPSRGRYKVYLIDEVHMLSTHSFNALLKTLEEPPPHVKFLLATTDPQKLPITILSRCLQFNLKSFMPDKIVAYLQSVLLAEAIQFDEPALWHLARAAHGSMRDALTLLDQAISFGEGVVREDSVRLLLGTPDHLLVFRLLDSVMQNDAAALLKCSADIAEHNANYPQLLENLLSALHRCALAQVLPDAIDNSNGDREHILRLAQALPPEDIQLYYQIALKTQQDLSAAADLRMAFDMFLLRLLAFTPDSPLQILEPGVQQKKKQLTPRVKVDAVSSEVANARAELKSEPEPAQDPEPRSEPELTYEPESTPKPISEPEPKPAQKFIPLLAVTPDNWPQVVHDCPVSGISASILANCVPEKISDAGIILLLDKTQSSLFNEQYTTVISSALEQYFEQPLKIEIRTGISTTESPAARRQRIKLEQRQSAIDNFSNDANVLEIVQKFSATIRTESITLRNEEQT